MMGQIENTNTNATYVHSTLPDADEDEEMPVTVELAPLELGLYELIVASSALALLLDDGRVTLFVVETLSPPLPLSVLEVSPAGVSIVVRELTVLRSCAEEET